MSWWRILLASALVVVVSCTQDKNQHTANNTVAMQRTHDVKLVAEGEQLFKSHCAICHGDNAEGDPNWRKRGADRMFPPPPLNGSGHAWHHSKVVLKNVIVNGSAPGQGNMPAWKDKLTDAQIDAVIEWMQSLWSDQVYAAWQEMQSSNH